MDLACKLHGSSMGQPKGLRSKSRQILPVVWAMLYCLQSMQLYTHRFIYIYIYVCVCALVVSGVLWVALTAWTSRFLLAGWQCPPSQGSSSLDPCESWLNCQRNIQKSGGFSHPCFYVCMCVCVCVCDCLCVFLFHRV